MKKQCMVVFVENNAGVADRHLRSPLRQMKEDTEDKLCRNIKRSGAKKRNFLLFRSHFPLPPLLLFLRNRPDSSLFTIL